MKVKIQNVETVMKHINHHLRTVPFTNKEKEIRKIKTEKNISDTDARKQLSISNSFLASGKTSYANVA